VQAGPAIQKRVEAFLKETRRRTQRQVLLEARIVEVTLGNDSQMGVDWNGLLSTNGKAALSSFQAGAVLNPNLGPSAGLLTVVAQSGRVQAALSALASTSRLRVLSSPRLATLNNQKAILRVVTEQAYATFSSQLTPGTATTGAVATASVTPLIVPEGIILDIQPQIGEDGYITLAVDPSVSTVTSVQTFSAPGLTSSSPPLASTSLPVVDRRDLDTVVRVKSGETLVLAGIIRTAETTTNRGIPWVRNIPLLGALFARDEKSVSRTELAIFITPTLMEEPGQIEAARATSEQRLTTAGAQVTPPPPPARTKVKVP